MPPSPALRKILGSRTPAWVLLSTLASLCGSPGSATAQFIDPDSSIIEEDELHQFLFYKGRPYGTDAYMGPLDVILNKGFAVAQFNNRNRYIFEYDYGYRHAWNSIVDFPANVERYGGWAKYIGDEILPTSLDWKSWKWMPNYGGHLLEGGMTYRRLAEWNRAHDVPVPRLSAAVVTMASAFINEMYAHPGYVEGTAATGTDLLFFDPLGIALFSIDGFAGFFAGPLQGNIWASQAALMLDGELVNNGNNIVLKLPISPVANT
jgi:hypothetical protein